MPEAKDKVFFSEEKKQKTFASSGICAAWTVRDCIGKKGRQRRWALPDLIRRP
jgi:hypothetical protein